MKREYFTAIFITVSAIIIFSSMYIFEEEQFDKAISRFIIVWLMIAFLAGQYSTKFPKTKE